MALAISPGDEAEVPLDGVDARGRGAGVAGVEAGAAEVPLDGVDARGRGAGVAGVEAGAADVGRGVAPMGVSCKPRPLTRPAVESAKGFSKFEKVDVALCQEKKWSPDDKEGENNVKIT